MTIVYVLTNPAMPGLVKIGMTDGNIDMRMGQLYSTGVPLPFTCEYAVELQNGDEVEAALHEAFGTSDLRPNPKREFFAIRPHQAIAILKTFHGKEMTPSVDAQLNNGVTPVERESAETYARKRHPRLNFDFMGISVGTVLKFKDEQHTVTVAENNKVSFNGELMSLTKATKRILENDAPIQPSPYWFYEGKTLKSHYEEAYVYGDDEEEGG